jgi:hypothetical protein
MNKVQMGFKQCKELLGSYGISLQGQIVTELDDALQVADELGYPVVLKALSSQIIHKTDVDVVFLEVIDRDAVRKTYSQIIKNTEQAGIENIAGILVQTMAKTGFELFIGAKQDPSFGPVTMVGHGGRFVELFADAAPGIGILEREDVLIMLSKTMAGRILDGFRGPRLDKGSVIDLTLRVSRLMAEHPEIHELDLNPVIVHEQGVSVVDSHLIQGDPIIYPRHTDLSKEQMKSLNSIFNPGSVAIVGASRSGTMGGIILKNCKRIKKIFPINPHLKTVQGMR